MHSQCRYLPASFLCVLQKIRNMHNEQLMGIRGEEEMEMSDDDTENSCTTNSKDSEDSGKQCSGATSPPAYTRHQQPTSKYQKLQLIEWPLEADSKSLSLTPLSPIVKWGRLHILPVDLLRS